MQFDAMKKRLLKNLNGIKNTGIIGWLYSFWEFKFHTEIPFCLAYMFKPKRRKEEVYLPTYDGSGQPVHPDVIEYKGNTFLTCTAYPYMIDLYENPELFVYNSKYKKWTRVFNEPLVKPDDSTKVHYSDPFLFEYMDNLYVFYRLTDKEKSPLSTILFNAYDKDLNLVNHGCFTNELERDFISPFFVEHNGYHFFYIQESLNKSVYVRYYNGIEGQPIYEKSVTIAGFEDNEEIWHIGCSSIDNFNSKRNLCGKFKLVITIYNLQNKTYYNCFGLLENIRGEWIITKQSAINFDGNISLRMFYKSCFASIDGTKKLILSVADKYLRNRVFMIEADDE